MSPGSQGAALVSVIIPAYNAASLVRETLDTVLAQSYAPLEIIVVDDGSKDSTPEVVAAYGSRVRLVRQSNSGGCSSPRNHGLRVCGGQYVTFFDADDLMCREKIAQQVSFLEAHPAAPAVLMDYRNFSERGPAARTHFDSCVQLRRQLGGAASAVLDPATATRLLIAENYGISGSPLFRRGALESGAAFDEKLKASEDFDLIYRVAATAGIGVIDAVGFQRRFHDGNMSNRVEHILNYKIASRQKLLRAESRAEHRRLLKASLARLTVDLAEFHTYHHRFRGMRQIGDALRYGHAPDRRWLKCVMRYALTAVRGAQ